MKESHLRDMPLTDKLYCYTGQFGDKYHTLYCAPLRRFHISNDHVIASKLGEREWIGKTNGPMYLIPANDPDGLKHCSRLEQFDLYPGGRAPENMRQLIELPMEFNSEVEPYFHYKIEGNFLFKRVKSGWLVIGTETTQEIEI